MNSKITDIIGLLIQCFSFFLRKYFNLKKARVFSLFFIFISFQLFAQNVRVFDSRNHEPIDDVFIIGDSLTTITNSQGKATITKLLEVTDTLVFQHPSFLTVKYSEKKLKESAYNLYLTPKIVALEEFTVSANKWEQKIDELPLRISSLQRDQLFFQPANTADLIGSTGEVYIQKSQQGGGSPMFRGFAANRILLVYDGVRVNNAIFRSGNLQNIILFDANSMESSEIVFGPGSTIYGSDALGGVIDFRTLNPEYSKDSSLLIYGQAKVGFASAANEYNGHVHFGIGGKRLSSITSFSYANFNDLRMGTNGPDDYLRNNYVERIDDKDSLLTNPNPRDQISSGYQQLNLVQKFGFKIGESIQLGLNLTYAHTDDIPRYDRLIVPKEKGLKYAEWFYGPQDWINASFTVLNEKKGLFSDEYRLIVAYQLSKESRHDRKFNQLNLRNRMETVDVYSFNFDLNKSFNPEVQLFYGIGITGNKIGSDADEKNISTGQVTPVPTRYPDGSNYWGGGIYALLKWKPGSQWILNFGLRYSLVAMNGTFDTTFFPFPKSDFKQFSNAITPSVGAVYHLSSKLRILANIGQGFRAPNIDDVAKVFDSTPGNVVVPNTDLKPETVTSFDLGLTWTPSERVQWEVSGFYSILNDMMVKAPFEINGEDSIFYDGELSKVEAIQNLGNGFIYGFQTTLRASLSQRFTLKGSLVYTQGEDGNGDPLRHVTPLFGAAHIEYLDKHVRVDLNIGSSGEISNANLAPSELDKPYLYAKDEGGNPFSPSWTLINLNASWFISNSVRLVVGVDNIFDKRYRGYSSGISGPGRNFLASIVVHF